MLSWVEHEKSFITWGLFEWSHNNKGADQPDTVVSWASSQENLILLYANNKGADSLGIHVLISTSVIDRLDAKFQDSS